MSRLIGDETGFTLVELMLVSVLMIVVLGATLTTFTQFERTNQTNERQNESQERVRRAIDALARELRNLASPTDELPQAVGRATPTDLIFQSVGRAKPAGTANARNTQRVRYCLDAAGTKLWRQEQRWTGATAPAMPAATECPATPTTGGWDTRAVAAETIVNGARAVFGYNSAEPTAITEIRASLFADASPRRLPGEVAAETSVFLRNQNRPPVARFTATAEGSSILLNGSQSEDPEQRALDYYWYDAGVSTNACGALPAEVPSTGCIGTGIVFTYSPSMLGTKRMYLVARDPAGLTHTAPEQSLCLSGPALVCVQ